MEYNWIYRLADIFFYIFHFILVIFIIFGWIWNKTRKAHLIVVAATVMSWFGLGYFYGWGYCFLTDWHWEIKRKLGQSIQTNSYIHFLIESSTGINLPERLVDQATFIIFLLIVVLVVVLQIKGLINRFQSKT